MTFLILVVLPLVIVFIAGAIALTFGYLREWKIFRQAEESEKTGDLQNAAKQYKRFILARVLDGEKVRMGLARLESVYKRMGVEAKTDELLQAHKVILDIWKSKIPASEKNELHKSAMEGLKIKLDALP
jgi:hypothetical protein